ncbi:MAG: hypothetical protein ACK4E3_11660 [Brevundimonas sp.]|jgi:hypothetical protein|uniref:hypothetical protein n=1 Tax=Brevundimonas sp. TaxID=1871086 RepID=UPI0039198ECB
MQNVESTFRVRRMPDPAFEAHAAWRAPRAVRASTVPANDFGYRRPVIAPQHRASARTMVRSLGRRERDFMIAGFGALMAGLLGAMAGLWLQL